ncbi:MAG: hypothetical protein ACHQJD_06485 [Thermoanaerobaculia bacterium]
MKRNKKPEQTVAASPDEFAAALARTLGSNVSSHSIKLYLMGSGHSEEHAVQVARTFRQFLLQLREVDYGAQLVITLGQLDRLLKVHMREGNRRAALEVLREQSKLLRLADHVRPFSDAERTERPRTNYENAMSELGPAGREIVRGVATQTAFELTGRLPDGSKPAATGSPETKAEPGPATVE